MNDADGLTARCPAPLPARVRGNDWRAVERALDVPALAFAPCLGVSVVVPCYQGSGELAIALAALEKQTYPRALFEVVVVDDGSEVPLEAPADSPLDLCIVRQPRHGFGLARARNNGVRAARHDIVVFLDADLVAAEDLIAAHARWHHAVADAVTLGFCRYVSAAGVDPPTVRASADLAGLFAGRSFDVPWTERHMARTGDLTAPRDDLFRAVVGNNIGVRRAFFDEIGDSTRRSTATAGRTPSSATGRRPAGACWCPNGPPWPGIRAVMRPTGDRASATPSPRSGRLARGGSRTRTSAPTAAAHVRYRAAWCGSTPGTAT